MVSFVRRALFAGMLVSVLCGLVGTWVVLRGMAFMSEAISHGMLPGVAVAYLAGANLLVGAAASAVVMILGVAWVSKNSRLSEDTGIGLLFVGMLALGVVIVSRARSFAVDLTAFLFGDVLSATRGDLIWLAAAAAVAGIVSVIAYRPLRRPRLRRTQGAHPGSAAAVGAPRAPRTGGPRGGRVVPHRRHPARVRPPRRSVRHRSTVRQVDRRDDGDCRAPRLVGHLRRLIVSWNADTAAGATIAGIAVLQFFVAALARSAARRLRPALLPTPMPVR